MARSPSPQSGRSSLQLPDVANGLNWPPSASESPGDGSNIPYYPYHTQWRSRDPRSSSTQSLLPSLTDREGRRTLLIIYVHGFMGNDSSFRSFPAHVHNFLKVALVETHVIHTKIYPRYKTYKAIDVARDNFSKWLEPHESPTTDIVLIGHSMGGLLAADVVLLPGYNTTYGSPLRHRILGTVSLDAPLLGLHPGIVVSGIASLFRPAATPVPGDGAGSISPGPSMYSEVSPPSGTPSPALMQFPPPPGSQSSSSDPYFNPPFFNDVSFIDRGWFKNIAHFAKKHKEENLVEAAASHILSHLEFGGCLADYPGLRTRYNRLRKLEDVDASSQPAGGQRTVRVRFVNYYTASTGLPKKPKPGAEKPLLLKPTDTRQSANGNASDIESRASTPRISIEDYSDSGRPALLQELEPVPEPDEPESESQPKSEEAASQATPSLTLVGEDSVSSTLAETASTENTADLDFQLPPIPDLPVPPEPPNLDSFPDKEARKQAEKEAKRAKKVYEQAVKNRDKAIKERQKLIEKRRRKSLKDTEKRAKEEQKVEQKRLAKEGQELKKELDALYLEQKKEEDIEEQQQGRGVSSQKQADSAPKPGGGEEKKKKERKFCMLPSKVNGLRDPAWVRVYMEGVDEVGAHCGLFFPGPHYETLVGDVGSMILEWVHEDASRRAISQLP